MNFKSFALKLMLIQKLKNKIIFRKNTNIILYHIEKFFFSYRFFYFSKNFYKSIC